MINSLILGDCLEKMGDIPDKSIGMILTDLPYAQTKVRWDIAIDLDKLWAQYNRIIKPSAVIALFGSQPFTSILGASNIKNLKYSWIWEKSRATGHLNAKKQPLTGFEDILIFYNSPPPIPSSGLS